MRTVMLSLLAALRVKPGTGIGTLTPVAAAILGISIVAALAADIAQLATVVTAMLIFLGQLRISTTGLPPASASRAVRARSHAMMIQAIPVAASTGYQNDQIGNSDSACERLAQEHLVAEADFQTLEAELAEAVDGSQDAFFILHSDKNDFGKIVDFRFRYLNLHAERLIGMTRQQVQGRRLCELIPVVRSDGLFDKYVQVAESGCPMQEEFAVQSPDIHAQWLCCQAVPLAHGIAVTLRDISERKRSEFELMESKAFLQSLIDCLPVLIFAKSFRTHDFGRMVVWNKAAEAVSGYPGSRVVGKTSGEIFPPKMVEKLDELDQKLLADPMVTVVPEFSFRRPDGDLRFMRSISVPLFGPNDQPEYMLGIVEDVTCRRQQELELRTQKAELIAVNDSSPLGLFRADPAGAYTYVNRTYEEIAGLALTQVLGTGWRQSIHPDDRDRVEREWMCSVRDHRAYHSVHRLLRSDGLLVWVSVKAASILVDGNVTGYVGSVDDITARCEAEQALLDSEKRLRTITDNLPALIAYVDPEERYRFCNSYYQDFFGADGQTLIGRTARDVLGDKAYSHAADKIARVLKGERVSFEREGRENGSHHFWRVEYIPDVTPDGIVIGFYVMVFDITELKLVENQLTILARFDSLTGLANRNQFNEKLTEAIARNSRSGLQMALMYLDIDHFKEINDSLGHHSGDEVFREFAQRLIACVRQTDTVARLAGDEFVIILDGLHAADEPVAIARKIILAMERDFEILGTRLRVTASIGIAVRQEHETDCGALLRRADMALYLAKAAGRNTFKFGC